MILEVVQFTTIKGTTIHKRNLQRIFKTLIGQAGLPPIRFHDLRHTSATLILNYDVPVIIVSRRLGHSRTSLTADGYGHPLPIMWNAAAELIDDLVIPPEGKLDEPITKK